MNCKPTFALDARGQVATHGYHDPVRGVWHDTESHDYAGLRDIQGIINYWAREPERQRRLGAHFIIDADGNIAYCASPRVITYAVARRNTGTVHVELVGFARFSMKMWFVRIKQLRAAARLMAWLHHEYGIPLKFDRNVGWSQHKHQPNQTHTDCGRSFPQGFVLRLARKYAR